MHRTPRHTCCLLPQVHLGFLALGGIYITDLLHLTPDPAGGAGAAAAGQAAAAQQVQVRDLGASNLSVSLEGQPDSSRVVLRLWADREGPFAADFVLVLAADQEVSAGGRAAAVAESLVLLLLGLLSCSETTG